MQALSVPINLGLSRWPVPFCYTSAVHEANPCARSVARRYSAARGCTGGNPARPRHAAGKTPPQRASTHLRRTECRSLLLRRRQEADLPIVPRRREVRPDLHHEHRRQRPAHGLNRQGTHHLQLLLSRWQEDSVLLHAPGQPRVPAAARFLQGLCLGSLCRIRHLHRESGRHRT